VEEKVRISQRLREAVKLAPRPAYRIAQDANLHPTVLSKLITGAESVRVADPRVLRVAEVLGIPAAQAFERREVRGR
jgi:hypothetical protein